MTEKVFLKRNKSIKAWKIRRKATNKARPKSICDEIVRGVNVGQGGEQVVSGQVGGAPDSRGLCLGQVRT